MKQRHQRLHLTRETVAVLASGRDSKFTDVSGRSRCNCFETSVDTEEEPGFLPAR